AANVQLGDIPAISAGIVARERVAMVSLGHDTPTAGALESGGLAPLVPGYLAGRFGRDQQVWQVESDDGRALEVGTLLQPDADHSDPLGALGVVIRPGGVVLVAAEHAKPGKTMAAQEKGRTSAVRLVSPHSNQ
ncbi:MAG: hypothetical protein KKF33_08290, partial [Alphaproteobacteria bacterium]|nr:hypothetical protein [Alphaproteobacteria bacterium]